MPSPFTQISDYNYDCGTIIDGEELRHTFKIYGDPVKTVRIQEIKVSCDSCTTALFSNGVIKPGGFTTVEVTLDSSGLRGEFERIVQLITDDPKQPSIELAIRGTVVPILQCQPEKIVFDKVISGQIATATVVIEPGRWPANNVASKESSSSKSGQGILEDFRIMRTETKKSWLKVEKIRRVESPGNIQYNIEVRLLPEAPVGPFSETMALYTDIEIKPRVVIPIVGEVVPAISISPAVLAFGPVKRSETSTETVTIQQFGKVPLKIVSVTCQDPRIDIQQETVREGEKYRLNVTFKSEGDKGRFETMIIIRTNSQIQPESNIRVFGYVKE